jgi:hypothetical protein
MPVIGGRPETACDFRHLRPDCAARGAFANHISVAPGPIARDHLFRVLGALNLAMTRTAFNSRDPGRFQRRLLVATAEKAGESAPGLSFGACDHDHVARTVTWMPRAYLAFKHAHRDRIFGWSTDDGLGRASPHYANGLRQAFCDDIGRSLPVHAPVSGTFVCAVKSAIDDLPTMDLVFEHGYCDRWVVRVARQARVHVLPSQAVCEGQLVASDGPREVPEGWDGMSLQRQWARELPRLAPPRRLAFWVRLWFERQFVAIRPGLVHIPSNLAALAARKHAVAEALYWDVSPAMACYDEAVDAFVFPPLQRHAGSDLVGVLPGEIAFDLTPTDPRYLPQRRGPRGRWFGPRPRKRHSGRKTAGAFGSS